MKTTNLLVLLVVSLLGFPLLVQSQVTGKEARKNFAESIQRVKVWTYIGDDTAYGCYSQAINAIFEALQEKGYQPVEVYYSGKAGLSRDAWRTKMISSLDSMTALVEVVTTLVYDCTLVTTTQSNQVVVVDPSGSHSSRYQFPEAIEKGYMFDISCSVYTRPPPATNTPFQPVYQDDARVAPQEFLQSIRTGLSWIPRSRNRTGMPSGYYNKDAVVAEFTFSAGYVFGSSMDITGGEVTYDPNATFGVDIGVFIMPGLSMTAGYHRESTHMNVASSRSVKEHGPIALSLNYILLGAQYQFNLTDHFSVFAGGSVGGVNTYYFDKFYRDIWYLATGLQSGVKVYLGDYAGFRIQGTFLYQVHPQNAPYLYSSQPDYVPLNSDSNMIQWGLDAGFILRLGHRK